MREPQTTQRDKKVEVNCNEKTDSNYFDADDCITFRGL